MRSLIAGLLVVVGALMTAPGGVAVWQERVFLDEDTFVSTIDEAFEQEEVQVAIAEQLTDVIMERAEIEDRIARGLANLEEERGEDLALLEGPLTGLAREAVFRVSLRLVEAQPLEEVRETALRGTHRLISALVFDDQEVLSISGDDLVLDLGVVLEEVIKEMGGGDGDGLLSQIDFPDDAGQIVIAENADVATVLDIVGVLDDVSPWVAVVAVAILALAVLISPHRRSTVIFVGVAVAVVSAIGLVTIEWPLRELSTDAIASTEAGKAAAKATYDVFLRSFQRQQLFVLLIGVGLAVVGSLSLDRRVIAAVRSRFGDAAPETEDPGQVGWVTENARQLRIGGLGIAAILLIAWPDPSTRAVITLLVLTAAYLATLTAASSDAQWAVSARSRASDLWDRFMRVPAAEGDGAPAGSSLSGWVGREAPWFRLIGIVLGAAVLIFLPSLSFGTFVLVVSLELLYLAAIDMIVNRAST
ncbi:MAG: hypothetical protein J4N36_06750 [Chloroflexi bacterium]|nr:hypothetical protein [Chloroflexota bacterium]MCI0815119.1 hypothetical protein [Chloroflexota bacterium]MCI0818592.1 hypothetical protein [Chloroflexota bacterium]MCI0819687.1 hypothetical protein [Chloroflexota bacterium]MCI0832650.1 hypothetical protein [Chloroflexota bacterium]